MNARRAALTLAALLTATFAPARAADDGSADAIEAARRALLARVDAARAVVGRDVTNDLILRLESDLVVPERPADVSQADFDAQIAAIRRLDAGLIDQVLNDRPVPLSDIRGLGETLVRSKADGTLQPVAVYVPPSLATTAGAPLVVALHGRPQSESELLGGPVLRALADRIHAVIVAPWGRGLYDYAEPAASDVYTLLDAATSALGTDPHRAYLLGYSMGGFAVYRVGPMHAERWAAIMSIAGSVLNSETFAVLFRLRDTPLYLVTGSQDDSIPTAYGEQSAAFLKARGLTVSFYEQPQGHHPMRTLVPALTDAWSDMLAGRVRSGDDRSAPRQAQPAAPAGATKT